MDQPKTMADVLRLAETIFGGIEPKPEPRQPKPAIRCDLERGTKLATVPERRGINVASNPQTGETLEMITCWIPDGRLATVRGYAGTLVHTDLGLFDVNTIKPARIIQLNHQGLQTDEMGS